MYYRELLEEAIRDVDPELSKAFNEALKEVFTQRYLNEISDKLKDYIIIKEIDEGPEVIAYNVGSKIFINKNTFYNVSLKGQAKYLLHEFIHILQRKRGVILSRFKDIRKLTNNLHKILKEHLRHPMSVFLTGKNQDLGHGGKWEILSYFMNDSIDWRAISEEGKRLVVSEIKNSGIFNTDSKFWKERLPY